MACRSNHVFKTKFSRRFDVYCRTILNLLSLQTGCSFLVLDFPKELDFGVDGRSWITGGGHETPRACVCRLCSKRQATRQYSEGNTIVLRQSQGLQTFDDHPALAHVMIRLLVSNLSTVE